MRYQVLAVVADPHSPGTDCRSRCDQDGCLGARRPMALERVWEPRSIVPWCPQSSPRQSRDLEEPCRRQGCLFCVRRKITSLSAAVEFVGPSHLLTVTGLELPWQPNRTRMNKLMRSLRSGRRRLEWFHVIEEQERSAHAHAHVLLRGDVPEAERLHELCTRAGFDYPDLQPLDRERHNPSYFLKVAAWTESSLAFHLQLNGGRLFHASRGFWVDPATGATLRSSQAESRARGFVPLGNGLTALEMWGWRRTHSLPPSVARKAA